ncbi:MAG: MFS transporter [Vulcanisaeta sp. AZ3]
MGVEDRSIEETDALVIRRAYYVLSVSITGLLLIMINWVGVSSIMYNIMSIRKIVLNAVYYVVPIVTAMTGLAVIQLPTIFILNRIGNKVSMSLGLLMNGLSLIFSTTSSYHTALLLRFLAGIGLGFYLAPSLLLILGWWSIRGLTRWVQVAYLSSVTAIITLTSIIVPEITQSIAPYLGVASIILAVIILFTVGDAVIIKKVPIMAIMNNPDVLMLGIAFSLPWGVYLSLIPLVMQTSGRLGMMALTVPLILTPLLYRYRHSVKIERRKILLYTTAAFGALTMVMGLHIYTDYLLLVLGTIFTLVLLLVLYMVNELVSPILMVQSVTYLFTISSIIGSIIGMIMAYAIQYLGVLGWVVIGILIIISSIIYRILRITL